MLQFHYLKSLKQMALALKVGLQRIDKHRFAEPAWTAQIIVLQSVVGQLPNYIAFINIEIILLANFF